jgi:hypothetical protein
MKLAKSSSHTEAVIMHERTWGLRITLALLLLASLSFAQTFTGTIRGTVTDQTGAMLPGASVTVVDVNTGLTRTMTSGAAGEYDFSSLPIGIYRIDVKAQGFKQAVQTGLDLHVNDIKVANFTLAIGSTGDQITVEANPVAVETQSGQVAGLVEGTQVRELPMNGRNFMQLTQLTPGVAAGAGAAGFNSQTKGLGGSANMTVSGSAGNGNLWLVDGANNNDYGSNRTILVYPSIDNIAEFNILRNSYGPEFGQAAGGVINIVTRNGGNQFHGSAYYFGRNDALNSRDWFLANANQDIGKLRRNDFGFTFGGPIKKDKLFFFYSEEWNREIRGFTRTGTVPTDLEKAGNFSGCASQAGLVGLSNLAALNPAGVSYLKMFPTANINPGCQSNSTLAGPNWIQSVPSTTNWREDSIRADYNINKQHTLMVRFSNDNWDNPYPNADPFYGLWGNDAFPSIEGGWKQPSRSLSAKLTSTIGNTMVNDFQFSYSHNQITTSLGGDKALLEEIDKAIPAIYTNKLAGSLPAYPTVWGSPYGNLWLEYPWGNKLDLFSIKDNFSRMINKHTFKAGFLYGTNKKNEYLGGGGFGEAVTLGSTPQFVYDLLHPGTVFSFSERDSERLAKVRWHDIEFYAGDSFRVHPRLTLEYGVRWSFFREPYSEDNTIGSFDPALYDPKSNSPCNGLLLPSGSNACSALGFGGAKTANNRSIRNSANNNIAPRVGFAFDPTGAGKWAIRGGVGQFFQRERVNALLGLGSNPPFSQSTSGNRILNSASPTTPGNSFAIGYGNPGYSIETVSHVPNTWQWNFTVEHEISRNMKLETSYVGSHGVHLLTAYDANQYHDFPTLGNVWTYGDRGSSIYHSLQTGFYGHIGHNLQVQTVYTFSKLISDVSGNFFGEIQNEKPNEVTDIHRPWLDRGLSQQDRPHVFATNVIYQLPKLEGEPGVLKHTFGNWETATIVTAGSGPAVSIFQGGSTPIRPNRVAGVSCEGTGSAMQIVNPAAFSLIPDTSIPGITGNASRGDCRGPGYANVDLAFYKNFEGLFAGSKFFSEGAKIQFRMEMFNAFNHPQFVMGTANLDFTSNGFGRATRTTGGREIQYALKFIF